MAPLKKIFRRCACFIEIFLAGSLFYVMLRRNPGSLPQERVIFKQIVKTGKMLSNMSKSQLFLPAANEVRGKVIFSQASICPWRGGVCGRHPQADTSLLSVHRGWQTSPWVGTHPWTDTPWADIPLGRHAPPWQTPPGRYTPYILKRSAGRALTDWYVNG